MQQQQQLLLWLATIAVLLLYLFILRHKSKSGARTDLKKASPRDYTLFEFRKLVGKHRERGQRMLLQEQAVKSLSHRYVGRFDAAVLHWETNPALDVVIERKFPTRNLPDKAREEDLFQAGLYALAIRDSGISCDSARLAVVYCLQNVAHECLSRNDRRSCWDCSHGQFFEAPFKPDRVERQLKRIDEIWYRGRKPKPASEPKRCIPCPYSQSGRCNYAVR